MGQKMNQYLSSFALLVVTILFIGTFPAFSQNTIAISAYGAFNKTTAGNGVQQQQANQAGGLVEFSHVSGPIAGFEVAYSYNRSNTTYSPDWTVYGSDWPNNMRDATPQECPTDDGCTRAMLSANAHQFTVDWTPSIPLRRYSLRNFRPFGVLGAGVLVDVPTSSQATVITDFPRGVPPSDPRTWPGTRQWPGPAVSFTTTSSTNLSVKPVYVYGAGLDWDLSRRLGLRFQYRGNIYSAPNMTKFSSAPYTYFSTTGSYMHTAEPAVGVYFHL